MADGPDKVTISLLRSSVDILGTIGTIHTLSGAWEGRYLPLQTFADIFHLAAR